MAKSTAKKKAQRKANGAKRSAKPAARSAQGAVKSRGEPAPLDPIGEALRRRRAALLAH